MTHHLDAIDRFDVDADELMTTHPPEWHHPNKHVVFDMSCPPGSGHAGIVHYSRWAATSLPQELVIADQTTRIEDRPGFFDYEPVLEGAVEWHVNFADPNLFVAYGSGLFAQDEMQVVEHPALGALKEALGARGRPGRTVDLATPTPVLIRGVERRCRVATDPNAGEGRPFGLYGNAFAGADPDTIARATTRIDPPTLTNLIAMAAPRPSVGPYTAEQIEYTLLAATTAFTAAVGESRDSGREDPAVAVHTGFWGCGAFGGNRVLMTTLQSIAAATAGVDLIVFHTGDPTGAPAVREAREVLTKLAESGPRVNTDGLIEQLVAMRFQWGASDGN